MGIMNVPAVSEQEPSRTKRLRAATRSAHENIDNRIMAAQPFASAENYVRFLVMQFWFHKAVDPLFRDARLADMLPDLEGRRRFDLIVADFADLGLPVPVLMDDAEPVTIPGDIATALGWLYVVEGSNLGAAVLLKEAAKLGFSDRFGARHLAGHPAGRGLHWRTFNAALDAVDLSAEEEVASIAGAQTAFRLVHDLADRNFSSFES